VGGMISARAIISRLKFWPRKPKLPPATIMELRFFSLDELRRIWQTPRVPAPSLRNTSIGRADLEAWIRWREHRKALRFWLVAAMTLVAMVASVIAAVEGWLALK
jgi:hypothetical protein